MTADHHYRILEKELETEVNEFFEGLSLKDGAYHTMFFLSDYPDKMRAAISQGKPTDAMHLAWEAKKIYKFARSKLYKEKGCETVKNDMRLIVNRLWEQMKPILRLAHLAAENPSCYNALIDLEKNREAILANYQRRMKRLEKRQFSDEDLDRLIMSLEMETEEIGRKKNEIIMAAAARNFLQDRGYGTDQTAE